MVELEKQPCMKANSDSSKLLNGAAGGHEKGRIVVHPWRKRETAARYRAYSREIGVIISLVAGREV